MVLAPRDRDLDTPSRGRGVAVLPRQGRNEVCHCGSARKYKRCCLESDEVTRRQARAAALPPWLLNSSSKLHQFVKYASNVFAVPSLLASITDSRRDPEISTFDVVNSLFHAAVLRIPSINALEGDLQEADFQRLIGRRPTQDVKAFSADVVANVLDKVDLEGPRAAVQDVICKAERNKAFREGSYGTLRCVAIDGWEIFSSYKRCCDHCLVRKVKVKRADGSIEEVDQYYHRVVVAMLLGPVVDVVLAIEPVRNDEARREADAGVHPGHEGELTAAHRLLDNLHATYGSFIDATVCDALYANGPWMTKLDQYNYGGFIILKKDHNEPLKEALAQWRGQPPCEQTYDPVKKEQLEFWDVDEIDTLDSYAGRVRVVRAVVTKTAPVARPGRVQPDAPAPTTWCFAVVGKRAQRVGRRTALEIARARWHIEDTAYVELHITGVMRSGTLCGVARRPRRVTVCIPPS